jgi:hypothetical protein
MYDVRNINHQVGPGLYEIPREIIKKTAWVNIDKVGFGQKEKREIAEKEEELNLPN